jgi:Ca-activated chloride channel family protein
MGRLLQSLVVAGFSVASLLVTFNVPSAAAQEEPGVIFVLDGSGSMWGQIEGRSKIEVAKEIMVRLVDELPPNIRTGLVSYGHRTKGECDDIETLAALGSDNREDLKARINSINPKGKTPITQSLILATEDLRQNEGESTVVLISDGKETCEGDPCAAVREMRAAGVRATVHVVGFDVSEEEREQLMCIAEAGNGRYFSADNATELNEALTEVKREVVEQAAEPEPRGVSLTAIAPAGQDVGPAVSWTIIDLATEDMQVIDDQGGQVNVPLKPGEYEVLAMAGDLSGLATITVQGVDGEQFEVVVKASETQGPFDAPEQVAAGTYMSFDWRGPNAPDDRIFISEPGMAHNRYNISNAHKVQSGTPARLVAPAKPGEYEIRYFSDANGTVLSRAPLTVGPPEVTMDYPDSLPAGSYLKATWTGPNAPGDRIFIAAPTMAHNRYSLSNAHSTKNGANFGLTIPAEPGQYEIRYFSDENATVLIRFPLDVTEHEVTIEAPRTIPAGTPMEVTWSGPCAPGDILFIAEPNMDKNKYWMSNNHACKNGSPARLTAPAKAGPHEIRYYSKANGTVVAKRTLLVQ